MPNNLPFSNNELSISSETGTVIGLLPSSGARPASSKVEEIMAKLATVRGKFNGTYTDNQESMPVEIDKALQYKLKELEERANRREIIREALLSDMTTPSSSSPCPAPTTSISTTTASTLSSSSSIEPSLALPTPPLPPSSSSQVETTPPLPPAQDQAVEEEEAVEGVVTVPTPPLPSPPLPIVEQEKQQPVSSLPTAGANSSSNINGHVANVVQGNIEEFFSSLDKDDQIASKRPPMPRMSLNVSHQIQDTPATTFALLRKAEQQALAATSVTRPVVSNSSNSTVSKPEPLTRVNSAKRLSTGNLATTSSSSSTADTTRKLSTMRAVGTVVAVSTHRPSTAPSSSASSSASRVSSSATAAPIRGVTGTAINRPPTSTTSSTATRPTISSFASSSRPSSNSSGSSSSSTAALATCRSSWEEEGAGEEAEKKGHVSRPSLPKDLQKEIEDIIAYEARQEESRRRLARLSKPKAKPPGSYRIPGVPDGMPGFAGPGGIGATVAVVKFKKSVGVLSSSAAASSSAASTPPSRPATTTSTSTSTPPPSPSSTSSSSSSSAGRPTTSSSSSSSSSTSTTTRRSITSSVPSTTSTTSTPSTTTATTQKRASFASSFPSTTSNSSSVTGVRSTSKDSSSSNGVGGRGGSSTSRGHVPTKSIGGLYQKEDLYS